MKKKRNLPKTVNVITVLILLVGTLVAYFVYQAPSKQNEYLVVNEWGVKFKNDSNKYSYDRGF